MRGKRLVDERKNPCVFPQTCLGHFYSMTPLVFPAASTGARCVSFDDFHGFPELYPLISAPLPFITLSAIKLVSCFIISPVSASCSTPMINFPRSEEHTSE